ELKAPNLKNDVSKDKCREHIEEALKQYWEEEESKETEEADLSKEEKGEETDEDDSDEDDLKEKTDDQQSDEKIDDEDDSKHEDSKEKDEDDEDSKDDDEATEEVDKDEESEEESKEQGDRSEHDQSREAKCDDCEESDEDKSDTKPGSAEDDEESKETVEDTKDDTEESKEQDEEVNTTKQDSDESKDEDKNVESDETEECDEDDEDENENDEDDEDDKDEKDTKETKSDEDASRESEVEPEKVTVKNPPVKASEEKESEEEEDETEESEEEEKVATKYAKDESSRKEVKRSTDKDEDEDESEEKEDETEEMMRSRSHIEDILKLDEIGTKEDIVEESLILSLFRELKKIYETAIKPLEQIYKYKHITTRLISDAEIFSKPMVLFLGSKGSGKTSLANYILGLQSTPWQLKTGLATGGHYFTVVSYGEKFTKLSSTELAADFAFSGLQQFGQHFIDHHMHAYRMPINILQKITIVDSPGLIEGPNFGKPSDGTKGIDSEVYQWFIDRSDVIYIVIDVTQLHMTSQLHSLIDQLKGREIRFVLSKADTVSHSQLILLIGQLLWMLSPVMTSEEPPKVYALTTSPMSEYDVFLDDQEQKWLTDLSEQLSGLERVEARVSAVRRHAVRVRNHAKLIDCYLATFYKNKGFFTFGASSRSLAAEITENPAQYRVFSGAVAGQSQNISRYDLPDPETYKEFFRSNPLIDFKPLSATCSFFKGCPLDKLDVAIAYQLPDLVSKYKKLSKSNTK
ncbi:sarcalumenin-like protein, partial [Dinothrombium tinctorium]